MEASKAHAFIQRLSKDTIEGKIKWERATKYAGLDIDSNPEIAFLFLNNEYRSVSYYESYESMIQSGTLFLLDVSTFSGRDGSRIRALELYIYGAMDQLQEIQIEQPYLYQLRNAIQSYMTQKESQIESFVDNYLET